MKNRADLSPDLVSGTTHVQTGVRPFSPVLPGSSHDAPEVLWRAGGSEVTARSVRQSTPPEDSFIYALGRVYNQALFFWMTRSRLCHARDSTFRIVSSFTFFPRELSSWTGREWPLCSGPGPPERCQLWLMQTLELWWSLD